MTRVIQFALCLVLVAASNGLPVEDQAPLVVDIPAVPSGSVSREEVQKPIKVPEVLSSDDDSVEILPIATSQDSSDEIDTVGSGIHSIFDLFNLNRPRPQAHPFFVFHRRPAIRDPFADVLEDRDESVVRPTQDVFVREQQRPTQNVFVQEQQPATSFDFMRHMDMMMQRVHQQLNNFMGFAHSQFQPRPVAPVRPHSNFRPIFPSFFDIHRNENETDSGEVINVDSLPANYTNSTSEIKEINGQQVQVNKTIKRVSNGNGSSFFQISVINYKPKGTTDKPAVAVEAEPAASDVVTKGPETETVQVTTEDAVKPEDTMKSEDPMMNEIDQLDNQHPQQSNEAATESFPFLLNRFKGQYEVEKASDDKKTETAEPLEPTVDVVPLPEQRRSQRMAYGGGDLSDDIRVNKIMAEQLKQAQIRMVHPDVELLDV